MILFETIQELNRTGKLDAMIKAGLLPSRIKSWIWIYKMYLIELEEGHNKTQAMQNVADENEISFDYVIKIRQKFERVQICTND